MGNADSPRWPDDCTLRAQQHRKEEIAVKTKVKTNAKNEENATNSFISTAEGFADVRPAIETFGEALPGLMLESVVDPDHPDHLRLHTWNGRRMTTARRVEHGGMSYIPKTLALSLIHI